MLSAVDEVKKLFQTLGFDSNKKLNGGKGADEHVRHLYATASCHVNIKMFSFVSVLNY